MLRDFILKILKNYQSESDKKSFPDSYLVNIINIDFPEYLAEITKNSDNYIFKGYCGKGNTWTCCPQIAILDTNVTEILKHGYYVIYIFSEDTNRLYLSLTRNIRGKNVATDEFKNRLESDALELRKMVGDVPKNFDIKSFSLGNHPYLNRYGNATICAKEYTLDNLPSEEELVSDYNEILGLYKLILRNSNGFDKELGIKKFIETVLKYYKGSRERGEKVGGHKLSDTFNDFARNLKEFANSHEFTENSERYKSKSVHYGFDKFVDSPNVYFKDQIQDNDYTVRYMFKRDMQGVYLSLLMGNEIIEKKYKKLNDNSISQGEFKQHFLKGLRDDLKEKTEIAEGFEESSEDTWFTRDTIYAKFYGKNKLPSERRLLGDLKEIFRLYRLLVPPIEGEEVIVVPNDIEIKKKEKNLNFFEDLREKGYLFDQKLIENFLLSLKVKPFVILTGNSGTGKTKVVQLFAQYLNKNVSIPPSFQEKKKVGRANKSHGWALDRSNFFKLFPRAGMPEGNYDIMVNGIKGEGRLLLSPRLFYELSGNNIKDMLDKMVEDDPDSEVDIEIFFQSEEGKQHKIVPVGANWTENRHIIGFYNVITEEYQKTSSLDLILDSQNNLLKPYFLILDEMNLSHVERYFSDFLSAMESQEAMPLHDNNEKEVPNELILPKNLMVVGTVNVDETTYMFSPKVLDRANTIEFLTHNPLGYMKSEFNGAKPSGNIEYLQNPLSDIDNKIRELNIGELRELMNDIKTKENMLLWDIISLEIDNIYNVLKKVGFDFGFRVVNEILRFMYVSWKYEREPETWENWERYFDAQIKQKMLPKLHGSQRTLQEVIRSLFEICYGAKIEKDPRLISNENLNTSKYPTAALKLREMDKVLYDQRYVSFIN